MAVTHRHIDRDNVAHRDTDAARDEDKDKHAHT